MGELELAVILGVGPLCLNEYRAFILGKDRLGVSVSLGNGGKNFLNIIAAELTVGYDLTFLGKVRLFNKIPGSILVSAILNLTCILKLDIALKADVVKVHNLISGCRSGKGYYVFTLLKLNGSNLKLCPIEILRLGSRIGRVCYVIINGNSLTVQVDLEHIVDLNLLLSASHTKYKSSLLCLGRIDLKGNGEFVGILKVVDKGVSAGIVGSGNALALCTLIGLTVVCSKICALCLKLAENSVVNDLVLGILFRLILRA